MIQVSNILSHFQLTYLGMSAIKKEILSGVTLNPDKVGQPYANQYLYSIY